MTLLPSLASVSLHDEPTEAARGERIEYRRGIPFANRRRYKLSGSLLAKWCGLGGASRARPHEYGGLDSESCVDLYAAAGLPLCMIHGLADVTVDPEASAAIFARARGPKAATWLRGADHHARSRMSECILVIVDVFGATCGDGPAGCLCVSAMQRSARLVDGRVHDLVP